MRDLQIIYQLYFSCSLTLFNAIFKNIKLYVDIMTCHKHGDGLNYSTPTVDIVYIPVIV